MSDELRLALTRAGDRADWLFALCCRALEETAGDLARALALALPAFHASEPPVEDMAEDSHVDETPEQRRAEPRNRLRRAPRRGDVVQTPQGKVGEVDNVHGPEETTHGHYAHVDNDDGSDQERYGRGLHRKGELRDPKSGAYYQDHGEEDMAEGIFGRNDQQGIDEPIHQGAGVDVLGRRYGVAGGKRIRLPGNHLERMDEQEDAGYHLDLAGTGSDYRGEEHERASQRQAQAQWQREHPAKTQITDPPPPPPKTARYLPELPAPPLQQQPQKTQLTAPPPAPEPRLLQRAPSAHLRHKGKPVPEDWQLDLTGGGTAEGEYFGPPPRRQGGDHLEEFADGNLSARQAAAATAASADMGRSARPAPQPPQPQQAQPQPQQHAQYDQPHQPLPPVIGPSARQQQQQRQGQRQQQAPAPDAEPDWDLDLTGGGDAEGEQFGLPAASQRRQQQQQPQQQQQQSPRLPSDPRKRAALKARYDWAARKQAGQAPRAAWAAKQEQARQTRLAHSGPPVVTDSRGRRVRVEREPDPREYDVEDPSKDRVLDARPVEEYDAELAGAVEPRKLSRRQEEAHEDARHVADNLGASIANREPLSGRRRRQIMGQVSGQSDEFVRGLFHALLGEAVPAKAGRRYLMGGIDHFLEHGEGKTARQARRSATRRHAEGGDPVNVLTQPVQGAKKRRRRPPV